MRLTVLRRELVKLVLQQESRSAKLSCSSLTFLASETLRFSVGDFGFVFLKVHEDLRLVFTHYYFPQIGLFQKYCFYVRSCFLTPHVTGGGDIANKAFTETSKQTESKAVFVTSCSQVKRHAPNHQYCQLPKKYRFRNLSCPISVFERG
jgi:gluconate kinase